MVSYGYPAFFIADQGSGISLKGALSMPFNLNIWQEYQMNPIMEADVHGCSLPTV
jgi:hypothetical protein